MATSVGRIDLVSETPQMVCIFELKLDKTAAIAFSQAEAKRYRERYSLDGKEILVLGVNFSSQSRNIGDWKGALYSSSGNLKQEFRPNI
ncbi:hypothetical protein NEPTK9_000925 [Candidatus Neptunochlamydia vexilliferae]|uniref:AAA-ATPase-like domain-containing protein n=2 Tax=Candidatus Neptunichlamydia vexilliferae TaxID=1651774 RepID=A0ABS0AZ60_9BACT|nr:hypothetical protein [Candidatus Neptunochlamydia vexilliferae]